MRIHEAFDIAEKVVNVLVTDFEASSCKEFVLSRLDITDETLSKALDAMQDDLKEKVEEEQEPPVNICPKCGADLFKVGVIEAISGGYSETEIHFRDRMTEMGKIDIQNFDEQWAICMKCGERIEYTAGDVIEAFGKVIRGDEQ